MLSRRVARGFAAGACSREAVGAGKRKFANRHSLSRVKLATQFAIREVQERVNPGYRALGLAAAVAVAALAGLGPCDTCGRLSLRT